MHQGIPALELTESPEATFPFLVNDVLVTYPYRAIGGGPATPGDYAFEELWTGGGCKAWARNFVFNGRTVHMVITDTEGTSLEADDDGACMIGIYEGSLEQMQRDDAIAIWIQLDQMTALSLDDFAARQEA